MLVVIKELKKVLSYADLVVIGQVTGTEVPEQRAPPYQESTLPEYIPTRYAYWIGISQVLHGETAEEIRACFYYRGDLKVSYEETGTGIETGLETGAKYVLIMSRLEDSTYEILRADRFEGFDIPLLESVIKAKQTQ